MNPNIPIKNVVYKEGIFVGYRWYETQMITPLYPFGYGLSYTNFEYSNLKLSKETIQKGDALTAAIEIKNVGKIAGAETVQLYVRDLVSSLPRPLKELKGFNKVLLNPGEKKTVEITLHEKDFSYWDPAKKNWYAEPGEFIIMVGAASNDIRQTANVVLK